LLGKSRAVDPTFGRMYRFVEIDHQPFLVLRKQAEAPRRVIKIRRFLPETSVSSTNPRNSAALR
jgi:hypothetical protein